MRNMFEKYIPGKKENNKSKKRDRSEGILIIEENYKITNNTKSPSELLSIMAQLMNYTATTIVSFSKIDDKAKKMPDKKDVYEMVMKSVGVYDLVDSGMDPEEAMEICGLTGEIREIPKD